LVAGAVQRHALLHAAQREAHAMLDLDAIESDFQQRCQFLQAQGSGPARCLRSDLYLVQYGSLLHDHVPAQCSAALRTRLQ
jgi:hypothetical protein